MKPKPLLLAAFVINLDTAEPRALCSPTAAASRS
jgi:hypothetical protein